MKTLKKALCIMLSVLMALSCLSVAAFAAQEEKFTSTFKAHSSMSDKQTAKLTLDELDEILKDMNIREEVVLSDALDLEITIDLTSVNALCKTIDDYAGILKFATVLGALILGDLRELDLSTWQKGLKRTGDDIKILNEFIELIAANKDLIRTVCDGTIDLGIFKNFVDIKDLLGEDGVSGLIRGLLVDMVYDEGTKEYNNAYNDIDSFLYNDLLVSYTKDIFPGLTVSKSSTIESLIVDIYNISLEKYLKPELLELDIDLSVSDVPEVMALGKILNLKGSTYDFSGLVYSHDVSFKSQINTVIGNYVKNILPSYDEWEKGGYEVFNTNLEKAIRYVAEETGVIEDTDKKDIDEIAVEVALIVLKSEDFGSYEEGLSECKSIEEMTTRLLINTSREMKTGVNYTGKESYLVVAGDLLASWAYDNFAFTDYNGKAYLPGGGKDVFEVANYFLNYFLFDRAGAKTLGLSVSKTDDVFVKLDKIIDYFGDDGNVDFSIKEFLLGASGKKGLVDCLFTFDIEKMLELTLVPVLDKAGNVAAEKFLYNTIKYFLDNWAGKGKSLLPAYQQNKAFANAFSNASIANIIGVFLETVNSRRADVVTLATFCAALLLGESESADYKITNASVSDMIATGKVLSPKASVTAGGKALTQDADYIVVSDAVAPGIHKVIIKGVGLYSGEIQRDFKVSMDNVKSISYTSTASTVTLSWDKVLYADGYKISVYNSSTKKYEVLEENTAKTSYAATALKSGAEYKFSVQALNAANGDSEPKEITAYTAPSAVKTSSVKATSTPGSIKLTWSAVSGATHYKLEQYKDKKWTTVTTTEQTGKTVSGLSGYTEYKFRITAIKKLSDGTTLSSSPVTVTAKTSLGTSSSLKTSSTATTVTLSWSKVNNAQKYQIRQYKNGEWVTLATTEALSYKVTGLKAASSNKLSVRAMAKEGSKWVYGSAKEITAYTAPSAVKASDVKTTSTPSSIKLTWSAVTGATHYKLEQYKDKKWTTVATTEKTGRTVSGLSGYTSYSFRITALKKLSDGSYLASEPVTVKAKTSLGTPSSLTAASTATTLTLSWSKVKNAEKYHIRRYTGGKWVTLGTTASASYKLTGLKVASKYKLSVRAMVKEGSKWVYGESKEITKYTSLSKPSSVKVSSSSVTKTSAKLSWQKVTGATSYEVYAYIGGKWVKKGSTAKTAMTVKELPSGSKTKLKVRAVAKLGGETVKSAFSSEITALTVVGKVTGLDTSLRKTNSISLKWKKTTGATSYEVYRYSGGKWKKLTTTSKTSYTDSASLKKGTEYKYKVRAVQKISSKTTRYGEYSSVLKTKTTIFGSSRF